MMLAVSVVLAVVAVVILVDVLRFLFSAKGGASGITNGLCRPLFGIFYPHLSMFAGLLVWMFEIIWVAVTAMLLLKIYCL
jgi:hypothetical protein